MTRQSRRFGTKRKSSWGLIPTIAGKIGASAIIERSKYDETIHHGTGWEIDHIVPAARGGGDDLSNLQPSQWENNRRKGDDYPAANYCAVTAAPYAEVSCGASKGSGLHFLAPILIVA